MDRRSFLKTTGAAAGVATLPVTASASEPFPAPAVSQGRRQLRLGTRFPLDQPGTSTFLIRLADSIAAMSDGRIELEAPSAVGAPADLMLGFPEGPASDEELALALDIVAGIPGGLDEPRALGWLHVCGGARLWSDIAFDGGLRQLYAGHTGLWPRLWSRLPEPIVETVAGIGIDMSGIGARIVRSLGASIAPSPDAMLVESLSPTCDLVSGLPAIYSQCRLTPFHDTGRIVALTMSRHLWDSLSSPDQAILAAAVASHTALIGAELAAHRFMAYNTIVGRYRPTEFRLATDLKNLVDEAIHRLLAVAAQGRTPAARLLASINGSKRLMLCPHKGPFVA
jgi:TRAP-type mannitol/chloroaromatic compound transport system substrate-binding protein